MVEFKWTGEAPPTDRQIAVRANKDISQWRAPEEYPVAFIYNGRNYAVMLSTPENLDDFAIGFSLTERVVDFPADIEEVEARCDQRGAELRIRIAPEKLERLDIRQQRRNLVGRAGCGVCGLENAEVFFEALPKVSTSPVTVDNRAMVKARASLAQLQPINNATRTVHAAAWASMSGDIRMVREDVGRHNALDKLVGALVRNNDNRKNGFVLMSSRCSYEIVEKAARAGICAVASISGPTAFAIRKAQEANISLYCGDGNEFVEIKY